MVQKPDWVQKGKPAVILAPMEGVTDAPMRALLSELGGFSYCVSEFLRISQEVPPARTYFEHIPELKAGSRTPSGTPVQVQLLGGDPEKMAEAAARAVDLGAQAIDINFGCPAPTVNRHDGGATLLKFPHRIRSIVEAVRKAVPAPLPVSAKLRLGWDSLDPIHENAERAAEGGAAWITIHGRTRMQGYQPPAYWGPIGEVNRRLGIPVVANGDLWTFEDFLRCRQETGCEHFMFGRSAMADPLLARRVSAALGLPIPGAAPEGPLPLRPLDWWPLIERFIVLNRVWFDSEHALVARVKQWIRMANLNRKVEWFDVLKRLTTLDEVQRFFREERREEDLGAEPRGLFVERPEPAAAAPLPAIPTA